MLNNNEILARLEKKYCRISGKEMIIEKLSDGYEILTRKENTVLHYKCPNKKWYNFHTNKYEDYDLE